MADVKLNITARPSHERGGANHGWLKTFHTFNFADYFDPKYDSFGCLRVINEDRVEPGTGFGTHGHREFEIFSYVVSGELLHKDSMGNKEVLRRGDLQMTSAGTGIRHSEETNGSKQVHFLQIWSLPSAPRLTPKYFTRHFTDEEKTNKWVRIVAPEGDSDVQLEREARGPAPVHSPLTLYATLISPGTTLSHTLTGRRAYAHVVQTSGYNTQHASGAKVRLAGQLEMSEGDGAFIQAGAQGAGVGVENVGDKVAEVLLFDLE